MQPSQPGSPDTPATGPAGTDPATPRVAAFADLDPVVLYALLRLRVDVFVVEQACPYPELDGRDTEPGTRHVWLDVGDGAVAYLRLLAEPDGAVRIGRVAVARHARGAGYATLLMRTALDLAGDRPCVLDAQSHLVDFYARLGFTPTGPRYVEDGIPHVPMRRPGPIAPRPDLGAPPPELRAAR